MHHVVINLRPTRQQAGPRNFLTEQNLGTYTPVRDNDGDAFDSPDRARPTSKDRSPQQEGNNHPGYVRSNSRSGASPLLVDRTPSNHSSRSSYFTNNDKITESVLFGQAVSALIFFNTICIGLEVAWIQDAQVAPYFEWIEAGLTVLYAAEMVWRLHDHRCGFFYGPGMAWNIFDLLVMSTSVMDAVLWSTGMEVSTGGEQVCRVFRILRLLRVFRAVRFFSDIESVVVMAGRATMKLFFLVALVIFVAAVVATHLLFDSGVSTKFGHLGQSMWSLLKLMTLGDIRSGVLDKIVDKRPNMVIFFVSFIFCASIALMSLVPAIFIALNLESRAREEEKNQARAQKRVEHRALHIVKRIFEFASAGTRSAVTWSEVSAALESEEGICLFHDQGSLEDATPRASGEKKVTFEPEASFASESFRAAERERQDTRLLFQCLFDDLDMRQRVAARGGLRIGNFDFTSLAFAASGSGQASMSLESLPPPKALTNGSSAGDVEPVALTCLELELAYDRARNCSMMQVWNTITSQGLLLQHVLFERSESSPDATGGQQRDRAASAAKRGSAGSSTGCSSSQLASISSAYSTPRGVPGPQWVRPEEGLVTKPKPLLKGIARPPNFRQVPEVPMLSPSPLPPAGTDGDLLLHSPRGTTGAPDRRGGHQAARGGTALSSRSASFSSAAGVECLLTPKLPPPPRNTIDPVAQPALGTLPHRGATPISSIAPNLSPETGTSVAAALSFPHASPDASGGGPQVFQGSDPSTRAAGVDRSPAGLLETAALPPGRDSLASALAALAAVAAAASAAGTQLRNSPRSSANLRAILEQLSQHPGGIAASDRHSLRQLAAPPAPVSSRGNGRLWQLAEEDSIATPLATDGAGDLDRMGNTGSGAALTFSGENGCNREPDEEAPITPGIHRPTDTSSARATPVGTPPHGIHRPADTSSVRATPVGNPPPGVGPSGAGTAGTAAGSSFSKKPPRSASAPPGSRGSGPPLRPPLRPPPLRQQGSGPLDAASQEMSTAACGSFPVLSEAVCLVANAGGRRALGGRCGSCWARCGHTCSGSCGFRLKPTALCRQCQPRWLLSITVSLLFR